jgi:transcriptional regulator with XRE-family HTH domain
MSEAESIGKYLKELREERRCSVEEVSEATKIKLENVAEIEADEIARRMPIVYVRALIKRYAEFLGADDTEVARRLKGLHRRVSSEMDASVVASLVKSREVGVPKRSLRPVIIGVVGVAGAILLYCVYVTIFYPYRLTVSATGRVPIEVHRDGRLVWESAIDAGRVKSWRAKRSIRLKIDLAENVEVIYRGRKIGLPGQGGVVVKLDQGDITTTPFVESQPGSGKGT